MGTPRNLSKLAENTDSSGVLGIASGGTGGSTAAAAKSALNLHAVASSGSYADLNNKPTTANITENTNLYYTDARARAAVSVSGSLSYNSTTGVFSYTTPSTSDITEGTNLYFTDARVRAAVSAGTNLSYNSSTGVFSTTLTQYTDALARAAVSAGTGLSYNSSTGVFSTSLTQYTDALARAAVSASGSLSYNSTTGVFSYTTPSTSGIAEGSNLYYTDTRARAAHSAGTGISYNSTTGAISSTITQYTDALARAAVSAGTGLSYNSSTGVFTNTITQYTDALAVSANTSAIATAKSEAIASAATDATNKANAAQAAAISAVTNGAGAAFDTLKEIQDAMATDAELAAAIASITVGNATQTISAGTGLSGGGSFTANQTAASTVTLSLGTAGTSGTYTKVTTDAYGRVTSGTTLSSGDIPSLSGLYLPLTGGTLTGGLIINAGGGYPLQTTANQRYQIGVKNTSASSQTQGWWLAHDTGGNFVFHADSNGDKVSIAASGFGLQVGVASTYDNPGGWNANVVASGTNHARVRVKGTTYNSSGDNEAYLWVDNTVGTHKTGLYSSTNFNLNVPNLYESGNRVLNSSNYNSYSPTLTGTGASGTWSISITGTANVANSATSAGYLTGGDSGFYGLLYNTLAGDLNTYNSPGLYSAEYIGSTNKPSGATNGHIIQISDAGGTDVKTQWYFPNGGSPYMRLMWGNTNWNPWLALLTSSNYNSYSPTLTGTGASGTWGISITGNSATTSQRAFSGDISATGQGRFTGWYTGNAATGNAAEIGMSGGQGYIFVYNRDTSAYGTLNIAASGANMQFSGSTINVGSGSLQQGGNQVLHAGNYTSYSPSLTGSGASGTWGISVTGSAGEIGGYRSDGWLRKVNDNTQFQMYGNTHTMIYRTDGNTNPHGGGGYAHIFYYGGSNDPDRKFIINTDGRLYSPYHGWLDTMSVAYASSAGTADQIDSWAFRNTGNNSAVNADTLESNGITYYTAGVTNFSGNATDGALYSQAYSSSWQHQIAGDYRSGQIALRGKNNGTWQSWRTVLDSSNYSSYALPLSGGTLSGSMTISPSATLSFGNGTRQMINLWSTNYGIGVQSSTTYFRTDSRFSWHRGGSHNDSENNPGGGTVAMTLDSASNLSVAGGVFPSGVIRAPQITAGGSTNTDANLGVQGTSHLTGTIYYGGSVGNVNSWSSISTSSSGTHTFSGSRFIFDRYGYGSQPLIDLQNGSITLSQPTTVSSVINATGPAIRQGNDLARPLASWGSSGATGMVIFKLPGSSGNYGMVHMVFDIYEYNSNSVSTVIVGGHNWASSWYNTGANVVGLCAKQVRLGYKDGQYCVVFGDASSYWEYGQIVLRKIQNGAYYTGIMDLGAAISVQFTATESFSAIGGDLRALRTPASFNAGGAITQAGNQVLHAGNINSYIPNWGTGVSGNYLVQRDGNGYIYANHINFNTTESENPSINSFITSNGDGWSRKSSLAHVKNSIRGVADGTWGISITGSSASCSGNASTASGLPTYYAGGQQTNPQVYFNENVGLRVAMTGAPSVWSDTLWINGYAGADVPNMCALHTIRNGTPRMWISTQSNRATSYGTYYEFLTTYNYTDYVTARTSSGRPGVYRLYRNDGDDPYNIQATWSPDASGYWSLRGFYNDGYHAACYVALSGRSNRANGNFYIDDNYGNGVVGVYASTRYQGVFAMGDSYKLPADGTSTGGLYGIAWSHPNAGGAAGNLTDHGMLIINNGAFKCAISNSIVASGNITAYSDERLKTNWRSMPENFVARLAQVRVGIYDRIDEEDTTQVGVSAQSFQELLPQAIMTAKDEMGTLSVSYGNAALASAVELAKEVVDLKTRVAQLEALINKLIKD